MRRIFIYIATVVSFVLITTTSSKAQYGAVTEREALSLASEIESKMNNNDATVLNNLLYKPAVLSIIKQKSKQAKKQPAAFFEGFASTFNTTTFGTQTAKSIKDGSYKLLRTYVADNKRHLLFRMFGASGLNYHDFTLIKVKDAIKADDVFAYVTGDYISTTISNMLDVGLAGQSMSEFSDDMQALLKMRSLKAEKKFPEVVKLFNTLDLRYQHNKDLQILYIEACRETDIQLYKTALEDYEKMFPGLPNAYLLMLDVYYLNKEYEQGLQTVDNLDSLLKGDPFLDYYRANYSVAAQEADKAKKYYENVFNYDPTVTSTIQTLVVIYMTRKEVDKAKAVISTYKKAKGFKQNYLVALYEIYPELKN